MKIDKVAGNYNEGESCENLITDLSRQDSCEKAAAVSFLINLGRLNLALRKCTNACVPCPCGI